MLKTSGLFGVSSCELKNFHHPIIRSDSSLERDVAALIKVREKVPRHRHGDASRPSVQCICSHWLLARVASVVSVCLIAFVPLSFSQEESLDKGLCGATLFDIAEGGEAPQSRREWSKRTPRRRS